MTTSDENWSSKLRLITEIERPDHSFLTPDDQCYFFGEYTARQGFEHSQTNDIIVNLKKPVSRRGRPEYAYKTGAIRRIAAALSRNFNQTARDCYCMVPIPPSKRPDHPDYDDRIIQICTQLNPPVPTCNVLQTGIDRTPAHECNDPRDPEALYQSLVFNETLRTQIAGKHIFLIDDVLCTGASFVACKRKLTETLPGTTVIGVFVARRVPERGFEGIFFDDI